MRLVRWIVITVAAVATLVGDGEAQRAESGVRLRVSGQAIGGEAMELDCALAPVAVPSNLFAGHCRLGVGVDRLELRAERGDDVADVHARLTVVLMGHVIVRGFAAQATGRFAALEEHGARGFPVYLHVDPLTRDWTVRTDVPGGGAEALATGVVTGGHIAFAIR
jgi:hypothetical protein